MSTGTAVSKKRSADIDFSVLYQKVLDKKDNNSIQAAALKVLFETIDGFVEPVEDLLNSLIGVFGVFDLPAWPDFEVDTAETKWECTKQVVTDQDEKLKEMNEKANEIGDLNVDEEAPDTSEVEDTGSAFSQAMSAARTRLTTMKTSAEAAEDLRDEIRQLRKEIDDLSWYSFEGCKNPLDYWNAFLMQTETIYTQAISVLKQALHVAASAIIALVSPVGDVLAAIFSFIQSLLSSLVEWLGIKKKVANEYGKNGQDNYEAGKEVSDNARSMESEVDL